jgi:hypothetical protein
LLSKSKSHRGRKRVDEKREEESGAKMAGRKVDVNGGKKRGPIIIIISIHIK